MNDDYENLEMICESFRGIVLRLGNQNDKNKIAHINTTDLQRRMDYYANIPDLPKEIKDRSALQMIAESYDFSDDVINELKRIHG
jgi:spore maturation protein CgeB